jgi:triosephosphate isomerase
MRTKIVAGNWKMNGSLASNEALLGGLVAGLEQCKGIEVAVFSPFPYLAQLKSVLTSSPIVWGAQTLSEHANGAYTGEVSAAMLNEFDCKYVLVGHSERRSLFAESDAVVAAKFAAAQAAGLIPVLCVGESLEEREAGATFAVVSRQLQAVLDRSGVESLRKAMLAYEPVWAIGTGRTASPAQAQEVHAALREFVAAASPVVAAELAILYGGSVKAQNAGDLFAQPDVDGGLIGGASLQVAEFVAICQAAGNF